MKPLPPSHEPRPSTEAAPSGLALVRARRTSAPLIAAALLAAPGLAAATPLEAADDPAPFAAATLVGALDPGDPRPLAKPGFQAGLSFRSIDNDAVSDSDDYYTHGFNFSWVSGDLEDWRGTGLPSWASAPLDDLAFLNREGDLKLFAHSISQRFFTPSDIEATSAPADDLPYSAFLYWTGTASAQNRERLDAVSVSLGFSGPPALGEEFQNGYHRLIGSNTAKGWDDQLRFEPVLNAAYERRQRWLSFGRESGWNGDVIGNAQGTLGNLITSATAGLTLRAGYRVPDDFRIPTPFLGDETVGLRRTSDDGQGFSLYGFVGLFATGIAHALYLDGNTFESGPSVDRRFGTTRIATGLTGRVRNVTVTASLEHAELPFDPPPGVDGDESYLRLTVSWER